MLYLKYILWYWSSLTETTCPPHPFSGPQFGSCHGGLHTQASKNMVLHGCYWNIWLGLKAAVPNVCVVCMLSVHWSKPDMTHQLFWTKLCQRWTICSRKLLSRASEKHALCVTHRTPLAVTGNCSKSALDSFQHSVEFAAATGLPHCWNCSKFTVDISVHLAVFYGWVLHWKPHFFTTFLMVFKYNKIHSQAFTLPLELIECNHSMYVCEFSFLAFLFVF